MPPSKQRSGAAKGNSNGSDRATKSDLKDLKGAFKMDLADFRSDFSKRSEQIDRRFGQMQTEMRTLHEESKRFMGALYEQARHDLQASLEFATDLPLKIDDHERRIKHFEEEVPVIKAAVGRAK